MNIAPSSQPERRRDGLSAVALVLVLGSWQAQAPRPAEKHDRAIHLGQLWTMRLDELLPADAAAYVRMASDCAHWGGEEPYDEARAREIARKSKQDCSKASQAKQRMEKKYPTGTGIRLRLDRIVKDVEAASDAFVWDDPDQTSQALNRYYESNAQAIVVAVDRLVASKDKDRLRLQQGTLDSVMANIDRLHPDTQKRIRESAAKLKEALK